MVGNNKVLTVSYGTFSCTLEGFEDSFETMKAIAEYFRDLAAEDRYFGAEPPQPDAELMARIAEREVARNVQARTEGGRVLLQTAPAAAPTAPEVDAGESAQEAVDAQPEFDAEPSNADLDASTADASDVTRDNDPVAETVEEAVEDAKDDEAEASLAEPTEEDEDEKRAEVRARRQARRAARAEAEAAAAAEVDEQLDEVDVAEASDEVVSDAEDVTSTAETETPAEQPADEAALEQEAEDALQAALANAEQSAADPEPVAEKPADDGDSLTAKLRRIQAVVGTAAVAGGAAAAAKATQEKAPEFSQEYSEDEHAEDFSETASGSPADAESAVTQTGSPFRVLKMKKKDFQAAIDDGALDEVDENGDEDGSIFADLDGLDELSDKVDAAEEGSSLSKEEEDELARELAALEDDGDEAPETPIASEAEDAFEETDSTVADEVSVATPGRAVLEQQADTAESSVNRLLEKTEEAMDEPGNKTRRNAISHLKAAVAATVADRKVGGTQTKTAEADQPYREDLARVVRPKRPTKPETPGAPKQEERPKAAPLKLVASQRVDGVAPEKEAAAQPVRPRRVAAQSAPESASPEFAAFAGAAGATEVPDMLEAAAAYTTFVEGNDVFSRPQVMRLVQSALPNGSFSREDGLRAFGTLLRQGRLKKIRGGQFEVTGQTRFADEAQAHNSERAAG